MAKARAIGRRMTASRGVMQALRPSSAAAPQDGRSAAEAREVLIRGRSERLWGCPDGVGHVPPCSSLERDLWRFPSDVPSLCGARGTSSSSRSRNNPRPNTTVATPAGRGIPPPSLRHQTALTGNWRQRQQPPKGNCHVPRSWRNCCPFFSRAAPSFGGIGPWLVQRGSGCWDVCTCKRGGHKEGRLPGLHEG